jgi:hypothetical protein
MMERESIVTRFESRDDPIKSTHVSALPCAGGLERLGVEKGKREE